MQISNLNNANDLNNYLKITNGIPRDIWHYMNKVFEEQYTLYNESEKLSIKAFDRAIERLVMETNYYEYYPRKSNARSDSMDIYSYFGYLFKLKKEDFNKNDFRETAGAGGSANNYLINMERIGLIEQYNSGKGIVRYKIRDNKIIYAVNNQLDIRKKGA